MAELKNKSILVCDLSGLFTHIAERLAEDFGQVFYFAQFQTGFKGTSKEFLPGLGLPNVERVAEFFKTFDKVDMLMFPDVGWGDLQEFLREEQYPVFGSGSGQILELDRSVLKSVMDVHGMASAKCELVRGIDELAKLLKKKKDLYVKFSYFRSDMETYHHKEWFASETWLHHLAVELGPYSQLAEFLVEEAIEGDCCEVGLDGYAVNGVMPESMLWGYECKDLAFLGTTAPLPPRLGRHAVEIENLLKPYHYSGILSTEAKITEDDEYLLDLCCRCPSPPSEIECVLMENFSDVVWEGAHGKLIEPEYRKLYGACLILRSDWIRDHPLGVEIGDKDRVLIHGHFKIDGKDYAIVPEEFPEFGAACGIGNSVEDAVGEAIEAAESVSAHQLEFSTSSFEQAIEAVKKGNELGLDWHNVGKLKAVI